MVSVLTLFPTMKKNLSIKHMFLFVLMNSGTVTFSYNFFPLVKHLILESEEVSFISITREQLLSYFPPFTIKKNLIRMLSCYLNNNFGWSQIKYIARGSEFAE